jgi:hypothetical protein
MNKIRIAGYHYQQLKSHLLPGDGLEAVAIALCGRSTHENNHTLLVQELLLVPYDVCYERKGDYVHWPTDVINPFLEKAAKKNLAIVKFHCHPGPGVYEQFSDLDNDSDYKLFKSIHAWVNDDLPHASCIMLPDGRLFGRLFTHDLCIEPVHQILVAGSDIQVWNYGQENHLMLEDLQVRNMQAFGKKTVKLMNQLKIGVVGCSGTGSPVIEQLKRLGAGTLVFVDPDFTDTVNINRIICSTRKDAEQQIFKVEVMRRGVEEVGMGTKVITFAKHISNRDVVKELADCDILISCVDGAEGRHILNLISSYYILPFIDMGVKLDADGQGGINNIFGTVHFVQPGGSSLLSRGQYNLDKLAAEGIKRTNEEEYARNQYLANVNESHPAVISINMQVAAIAVNELLARIHPYRNISNADIDMVKVFFTDATSYPEASAAPCPYFSKLTGKGDIEPLLNNPELSDVTAAA